VHFTNVTCGLNATPVSCNLDGSFVSAPSFCRLLMLGLLKPAQLELLNCLKANELAHKLKKNKGDCQAETKLFRTFGEQLHIYF